MATDWTAEQKEFYYDIAFDGFGITVRTPGEPGTFDPVTLQYVGSTADVDVNTYAIIKNYSTKEIDGTIIQASDFRLIIPAYGLVSELNKTTMQILISSVVQNIINIKRFAPANVSLGYEVQVRNV